jgi:hypothetical protein
MTTKNRGKENSQELKKLEITFKVASELNALRRKSLHDMAFSTTLFVSGQGCVCRQESAEFLDKGRSNLLSKETSGLHCAFSPF